MAVERNWPRRNLFHELTTPEIEMLIQPFAAGVRVLEATPLTGGRRNSNYRLRLSAEPELVALRVHQSVDLPGACEREVALSSLVDPCVPMPRVLHAEPNADPPWSIVRWLPGDRFDEFLVSASVEDVAATSRSAGSTLAIIHSHLFEKPGWFGADLSLGPPPWPDITWAEMLSGWLLTGAMGTRLQPKVRDDLLQLIEDNAATMAPLMSGALLVHADYKPWNLLIQNGALSGVADWEGAYSGNPLVDLGIYLRYSDRLPPVYRDSFAAGYVEAGGHLPDEWFRLARLTDLTNLGFFLEFSGNDAAVRRDVIYLIDRTLSDFAR